MQMALEDELQQRRPKGIKTETLEHSLSVPPLLPEIVAEILLKLPVESLLRCKAVCKLWNSLISHPHFIKSHLILSTRNKHYAHHRLNFSIERIINLKTCSLYDVLHDKSANAVEFDYPLKHTGKPVWKACFCNGLLCIAHNRYTLFILNPTTRKFNRLPFCGFKDRSGRFLSLGFGYDVSTDDYKVVGMSRAENLGTKVKTYSLKTGNWKNIGDFPLGMPWDAYGMFCNGALHWAGSRDLDSIDSWSIVSLDLAKETYGKVLQPVYDEGDKNLTLGVLGEWLCVLCNYDGNHADLWVMKVYGMKDSWTKLVSIPYLTGLTGPGFYQFSVPLCMLNNGMFLLQLGMLKLALYDSNNSSFSDIWNTDNCLEAYTYVESLVSPHPPSRPLR